MNDGGILVVHHSMGGHTKELADDLAAGLSAVVEPVLGPPGGGPWRFGPLLVSALLRRPVEPARLVNDPTRFDLVLVGGPIWMGRVTPPVRGFLERCRGRLPRVGFFVSAGRCGPEGAFEDMARLLGAAPVAVLCVDDHDRLTGARHGKALAFADRLDRLQARACQ